MPITAPCYIESPDTGIIKDLENSSFNFYKTGSRFFNTATRKSDYDFFAEFNSETLLFLEGLGFKQLTCLFDVHASNSECSVPEYSDPSVHSVFRKFNFRKQIDVQLIHPDWMDIKILAHEVILKNHWFNQDKVALRDTWTTVLRTLKFLKKEKHLSG